MKMRHKMDKLDLEIWLQRNHKDIYDKWFPYRNFNVLSHFVYDFYPDVWKEFKQQEKDGIVNVHVTMMG
jgi:hypothetical protein